MHTIILEVVAISTLIDSRIRVTRNGQTSSPKMPIETVLFRTPYADDEFEGSDVVRTANVSGPYLFDKGADVEITIYDPERQGKFKVGDRIDFLKGLVPLVDPKQNQ
jgi:hypothetical protein